MFIGGRRRRVHRHLGKAAALCTSGGAAESMACDTCINNPSTCPTTACDAEADCGAGWIACANTCM